MHKKGLILVIILLIMGCKKEDTLWNGYIDAELVYLSSDFSGRLTELAVHKGQRVNNKQFLYRLEQQSEHYEIKMSQFHFKELQTQRQNIQVQLHYNTINYNRISGMRKKNAASQNDLDIAFRDLKSSKHQLADIDAQLKSAHVDIANKKWVLTRKENNAPEAGIVFDTYFTQGELVSASYPVVSLVTPTNIKAIFFISQNQLSKLRLNERVRIKTESNAELARGHIAYISNIAEYTPPVIYSREESARLVFRIEAKIDSPDLEKIHLGEPVLLELLQ